MHRYLGPLSIMLLDSTKAKRSLNKAGIIYHDSANDCIMRKQWCKRCFQLLHKWPSRNIRSHLKGPDPSWPAKIITAQPSFVQGSVNHLCHTLENILSL